MHQLRIPRDGCFLPKFVDVMPWPLSSFAAVSLLAIGLWNGHLAQTWNVGTMRDRYRYPDIIGKIQDNTDSRWIHSTSRTMQYKHTIQPLEIACVFTCLHWRHLSPSPWGVGQATSENEKTSHGWLGTLKRQVVFFMVVYSLVSSSLWRFPKLWPRDCKLACLPPGAAQKQYLERTSRYGISIQWSGNLSLESSNMEPRSRWFA